MNRFTFTGNDIVASDGSDITPDIGDVIDFRHSFDFKGLKMAQAAASMLKLPCRAVYQNGGKSARIIYVHADSPAAIFLHPHHDTMNDVLNSTTIYGIKAFVLGVNEFGCFDVVLLGTYFNLRRWSEVLESVLHSVYKECAITIILQEVK